MPDPLSTWYSVLVTKGTSKLWDVGHRSSSFFPVKMSMATMCALACPCLPVFEVDTSTHLQGLPLIIRCEPLRISPACCGYVADAPDSAVSKVGSSSAIFRSPGGPRRAGGARGR